MDRATIITLGSATIGIAGVIVYSVLVWTWPARTLLWSGLIVAIAGVAVLTVMRVFIVGPTPEFIGWVIDYVGGSLVAGGLSLVTLGAIVAAIVRAIEARNGREPF